MGHLTVPPTSAPGVSSKSECDSQGTLLVSLREVDHSVWIFSTDNLWIKRGLFDPESLQIPPEKYLSLLQIGVNEGGKNRRVRSKREKNLRIE